jgi:hypothetical protein
MPTILVNKKEFFLATMFGCVSVKYENLLKAVIKKQQEADPPRSLLKVHWLIH